MTKVHISYDEWYPVATITKNKFFAAYAICIDNEDLVRVNNAFDEFYWAQKLLKKLGKEQHNDNDD